jgi:hypothetical protein
MIDIQYQNDTVIKSNVVTGYLNKSNIDIIAMDNNIIYSALKKQCVCIAAITVMVPLLLFSSIEFSGYNNNSLSLVKYAVAQQDGSSNNNVGNTMSIILNQPSSSSVPATAIATTTTNAMIILIRGIFPYYPTIELIPSSELSRIKSKNKISVTGASSYLHCVINGLY